ncbi:MAG: glycine oxidase ThiO [Acidobacteriota bacterium]
MSAHTDVVVIGGGIIGLSIAREAARAGLSARLLETRRPGGEASGAAAGMLMPHVEAEHPGPLQDLGARSYELYGGFVEEIREESGVDPGFARRGTIQPARSAEEASALEARGAILRAAALRFERLNGSEARRLEPGLTDRIEGALFYPDDASLDCTLLMRGLHLAAARAGVQVHAGEPATGLTVERGRVVGVEAGGVRYGAATVVVAAGAWSGAIGGGGLRGPSTHPVRGQILCLDPVDSPPHHILYTGSHYLVRRGDGRILAGSTMERVGFDARVTAEGVATLSRAALSLMPALSSATFEAAWAGLRPATDDGLPAIGPGSAPGLLYACGHLRHGILLAPITAQIVLALLREEPQEIDLGPFDPRRLAGGRGRTGSEGRGTDPSSGA